MNYKTYQVKSRWDFREKWEIEIVLQFGWKRLASGFNLVH